MERAPLPQALLVVDLQVHPSGPAGYVSQVRYIMRPLIWARETLARHPRLPRAVKAALAAVMAWLIVQPFGGVADEFPYYAPLGAVIAVASTVADSVRASVRGLLAISFGAALAMTVGAALPGPLALAVVVLAGTLVAGWWRLGEMGGWVPISALFVLIIGHTDPGEYVLGYVGLTGLGALVGIAVNAILPPLPLAPGAREIAVVRESVAAQLEDLADALHHRKPLTDDEWLDRYHDIRPNAGAMARLVARTSDARRVNWRVSRWRQRADEQAAHARALERLSLVVDDLSTLLVDTKHDLAGTSLDGHGLNESAAQALEAVASALRGDETSSERGVATDAAVRRYVEAVGERAGGADAGLLTAGAIATALHQVVLSLEPEQAAREASRQGELTDRRRRGEPTP